MLYELHEMQHAYFAPWRALAEAAVGLYGHPTSPLSYSPVSRAIAASSELILRTTQRYDKPRFNLPETVHAGQTVSVREEVLIDLPFCQLLHFRKEGVEHDVINANDGEYAFIEIELKQG